MMSATSTQTGLPIPIACALPPAGLAQRSATLKADLFSTVEERRALPDGLAYRFDGGDEQMNALFGFIADERACCPFLSFALAFGPDHGPIWLHITGPEDAQTFIRETFA
jgi:hypothetical protein